MEKSTRTKRMPYEAPRVEIIQLSTEDVLTTSMEFFDKDMVEFDDLGFTF